MPLAACSRALRRLRAELTSECASSSFLLKEQQPPRLCHAMKRFPGSILCSLRAKVVPYAGHCKHLTPEYKKLGEAVAASPALKSRVVIAKASPESIAWPHMKKYRQ